MSLLGCVQSLVLLDAFKGMWSQLRKSVDDITLRSNHKCSEEQGKN